MEGILHFPSTLQYVHQFNLVIRQSISSFMFSFSVSEVQSHFSSYFLSLGLPKGFKCWHAFGFRGRIYWPWENLWERIYSWENLLASTTA